VNLSPEKLFVIGILALLVLGPNKLPEVARSAGKLLADLRRMSGALQSELKGALTEPQQALAHAVDEFGIKDLRSSMRDTLTSVSGVAAAVTGSPAAPAAPPPPALSAPGSTAPGSAVAGVTSPPANPAPAPDPPASFRSAGPSVASPVPDDPSFN
jgi:sec-independent protein translocase protein TatB